jgi:HemK-related putative methylase
MVDRAVSATFDVGSPGPVGRLIGRMLYLYARLTSQTRYDEYRLEHVLGMPILVLPTVSNPKLLRTGEYFASTLESAGIDSSMDVLDMGTGSGVCALVAARPARHVTAVDINRQAVRCATINAQLNQLEQRISVLHGDLFAPVEDRRFDLILFNPPFLEGAPRDDRDAAWRSVDVARRLALELRAHLKPRGSALLLLSSFGDSAGRFIAPLLEQGYSLSVFARRQYVNENVVILRVTPDGAS